MRIRRGKNVVAEELTNGEGEFEAVLGPGQYEITYTFGNSKVIRLFEIRKGLFTRVNGRLRQGDGEVIIIRERNRVREATATNFDPTKTPPYSDKAIEANFWARAWFVLDVDREGKVLRVKFMHRPTHDLEDHALAEAFKLKFTPSINMHGQRIKTLVVWSMEWPAYWWLIDMQGSAEKMPRRHNAAFDTAGLLRGQVTEGSLRSSHIENQVPKGRPSNRGAFGTGFGVRSGDIPFRPPNKTIADSVPCRGSGPLNLESISSVFRDCTLPDFEKLWHSEPWIYPGEKASKLY